MSDKIVIKESVRGIIEYILRTGSIDDRFVGSTRAVEGTIAHQKLQSNNEKIYDNYEKEVRLSEEFKIEEVTLIVDGRADGIIIEEYKKWVILKSNLIGDRNKSITTLKFPFEKYRLGQRELAKACFNTIREKSVLFAKAPSRLTHNMLKTP